MKDFLLFDELGQECTEHLLEFMENNLDDIENQANIIIIQTKAGFDRFMNESAWFRELGIEWTNGPILLFYWFEWGMLFDGQDLFFENLIKVYRQLREA